MPLSSKRIIISDESVNRYGFWTLTSGVDMTHFIKNPICYYLHRRSDKDSNVVSLPIGHWQDIEVKDGVISAVPFFSDEDEFAMKIYHKVEEGTIRMASAGLIPIEVSEAEHLRKEGQTLPALVKSEMLEASIADIGVNYNALTLYDNRDGVIKLSASSQEDAAKLLSELSSNHVSIKNTNMNPQLLALAILLGLGKDATEIQLAEKMTANHAELLKLQKENADLASAKTDLDNKLKALELATANKEIDGYLALAVKEGKITQKQVEGFKELATLNFDSVKATIDLMPTHTSAEARMQGSSATAAQDNPLLKLSFDEAHKAGKLAEIKEKHPDYYKTIFKAHFGKDPK